MSDAGDAGVVMVRFSSTGVWRQATNGDVEAPKQTMTRAPRMAVTLGDGSRKSS
jgi:hypothetical protein